MIAGDSSHEQKEWPMGNFNNSYNAKALLCLNQSLRRRVFFSRGLMHYHIRCSLSIFAGKKSIYSLTWDTRICMDA